MPVYIIGASEGGAIVKIGWTTDINTRLRGLQTGSPDCLAILRLIHCEQAGERWMHARYKHLRTNGEWFRSDPEMFTVEVPKIQPTPPIEKLPVTLESVRQNPHRLLGKALPEMAGRVFDYDLGKWVEGTPDQANQYSLLAFNNRMRSEVAYAVSLGIPVDRIADALRDEIAALLTQAVAA